MHTPLPATLPRELRPYLDLINQVFEIEKKATALTETHSIQRNIRNMRNWFERELVFKVGDQLTTFSFTFHNPLGESYSETRTDCDASIAGSSTEDLVITEVIKPIVWLTIGGVGKNIVQQAVVVVESTQPVPVTEAPAYQESSERGITYTFSSGINPLADTQPREAATGGDQPIADLNPTAVDTDNAPEIDTAAASSATQPTNS